MKLLISIIIAISGGYIGFKIIPGGAMIGAIIAVAFYNILTGSATFNASIGGLNLKFLTHALLGGMIGVSFTKSNFIKLKEILAPTLLGVLLIMILAVVLSLIINKYTNISALTAYLGLAPGGIASMTVMGEALKADVTVVATIHLFRLIVTFAFLPILVKITSKLIS